MRNRKDIRGKRALIALILCVVMMLALSVFVYADSEDASSLYGTFWALLPPIIAIVLALITKEAYSSLFIGVVIGALLAAGGNPVQALNYAVSDDGGMISAIADNAGIFLFLVLLGIIVQLINLSGGSAAFGRWAEKNIKTRVGAQLATFILGVLIFIDDYFNCLTVGSVMLPITDRHKISRAKLSYLIDATAAPICMIAPVSSWAAAVSGVADSMDSGISGIQLFVKAIPYNFYSLLTFVFIIGIVVMKFDYGPMKLHEMNAMLNGDLGGLEGSEAAEDHGKGKVSDLIIPVIILIVFCTIGMLYVGGYFGVDWWGDEGCAGDFIGAFGNTDAYVGLPWGSIVALIIIVIYFLIRKVVTFKEAMECVPKGFIAMVPAMCILTLAVSLKSMTGLLGAKDFVHDVMLGASASLYSMLPAVIFVVAVFLAFSTGTSWGTFGILIPIVMSVFPVDSKLLIIGISACLAGAVCGDHCSPISDTTIMASAGGQIQHINHVSTQLPYALTVAAVSFVTYIIAGFAQNAIISLIVGAALMIAVLFGIKKIDAGKN
ncbi:MAG: Na+/H+ antiporter NhaC family protein [Firmicutes bacterium]|nr:Na+/H+ antiporter NhaC family protein [Bacillota bacterium]